MARMILVDKDKTTYEKKTRAASSVPLADYDSLDGIRRQHKVELQLADNNNSEECDSSADTKS